MGRPMLPERRGTLSLRLPIEIIEVLGEEADLLGKSRTAIIEDVLTVWVATRQDERKLTRNRAALVVHHLKLDDEEHPWHRLQVYSEYGEEVEDALRIWAEILAAARTDTRIRLLLGAARLSDAWSATEGGS